MNYMRTVRHNCETDGCFRRKCPKLGAFDDCFPRQIGMTDIDGFVERAGHFLFLEWKLPRSEMPLGQSKSYIELSLSPKVTFIIVTGNPETMEPESFRVLKGGKFDPILEEPPAHVTLDELRAWITNWSNTVWMRSAT